MFMNKIQTRNFMGSTIRLVSLIVCCLVVTTTSAQDQQPNAAEAPDQEQQPANESGQEQGIRHIAAADAINNVGETLAVCGNVAAGVYNRRSQQKNTYLNFDKAFPENTFTAIIFRKNRKHFDYKPEKLEGKWICVYGLVAMMNGKPEINVIIPEQIVAKEYPD